MIKIYTDNTSRNEWGIKFKKFNPSYLWTHRRGDNNEYQCYFEIWLWYCIGNQWKWTNIYFLKNK